MPVANIVVLRLHCRRLGDHPNKGAIVISERGLQHLVGHHRSSPKLPQLHKWLNKIGCCAFRTGECPITVVNSVLAEANIIIEPVDLETFIGALTSAIPEMPMALLSPSSGESDMSLLNGCGLPAPQTEANICEDPELPPLADEVDTDMRGPDAHIVSTVPVEGTDISEIIVAKLDSRFALGDWGADRPSNASSAQQLVIYQSMTHDELIAQLMKQDTRVDTLKTMFIEKKKESYNISRRLDRQIAQTKKFQILATPKHRCMDIVPAGKTGRLGLHGVLALGIRRNLTSIACADVASFMMETWTCQKVA